MPQFTERFRRNGGISVFFAAGSFVDGFEEVSLVKFGEELAALFRIVSLAGAMLHNAAS